MMRILKKRIPLFLAAAVTAMTTAAGEYFYHFPESLLPEAEQREWLLRRGELALFSGNIRCAEAVLQALEEQNPLIDKKMFPILLNMAKNQQEKVMTLLLVKAHSNLDTPECELSRCILGELLLESGNPCAAIFEFQKLAGRPKTAVSWRIAARRGEVLGWIRLGDFGKADALLRKTRLEFPHADSAFHLPELLNLSCSGRSNLLLERWKEMKSAFEPRPEPILYRLLMVGAEQAKEHQEYQTAQELFSAAYNYTSDDAERKDIFRKLLNIQRENSPENALATISRFLNFFPDQPDRFELELLRGELFYKIDQYKRAIDCFFKLTMDSGVPAEFRLRAAESAAQAAEKSKDFAFARRMYGEAVRLAQSDEHRQDLQIELLKFLLRTQDFSAAVAFAAGLESVMGKENDELNLLYLQALIAQKDFQNGEKIALRLSRSPVNAAEGVFQLAFIMDQQGKKAEARKMYLQCFNRFAHSIHAPEALFAAAEIAFQSKDYRVAGWEFEKFAQRFPAHTKAPAALLNAICSVKAQNIADNDLYDDLEKIEHLNGEISVKFPNTPEHDTAALLTAESLFYAEQYSDAVALLDELFRRSPKSPLLPELLLLKARCLTEQRKSPEALRMLSDVVEKYPHSPVAADAALEAGKCACRIGNYPLALNYYRKVAELNGSEIIRTAALCESADCFLLLKDQPNLEKALANYRKVAANSSYPPLQLEAAFKCGVVLEQISRPAEAINFYEKVLTLVHADRKYLLYPGVPEWCARAAQAALQLLVKANLSNGLQRAAKIYRIYKDFSIPGSSKELERDREIISKYYNFHPSKK